MAKQLSQAGEDQLSAKTVRPTGRLHVDNTLISDSVIISYSYSANMQYGAMSLSCEILNNTGTYSPDNPSSIFKFGKKIELWEGLDTGDSADEFKKFTGIIRQIEARKSGGRNSILVTAMDYIIRLEDLDVEYTFEATKQAVSNETLVPVGGIVDPSATYICDTFNSVHPYWADSPPPTIRLKEIQDQNEDVLFNGFDVHSISGQVIMATPVNKNNVEIHADYSYYSDWKYIEDAMRTLITQPDGYGNTPFTNSDMTQTFQAVEGAIPDPLTTYTDGTGAPINGDTTDDITYLARDVLSTDTQITVLDASKLPNASGYIKIEDEYISYGGKSGNILTGCTRGVWASTAIKHYMATPVRQAWEAKRLWYCSYSNVITSLISTDFSGLEGKFSSFNKQYGRAILTSALTGSSPTCTSNYSFYTIQATGISFVYAKFTNQDTKNRFEAIQAFRKILPPNYIIRTLGDGKIWGQFLSQKVTADYTLKLATSLSYAQDADIYTRVKVFGKNASPVPVNSKAFVTGFYYTSSTTGTALELRPEPTTRVFADPSADWHLLSTTIDCEIIFDTLPVLYMNGLRLDNTKQLLQQRPVKSNKNSSRNILDENPPKPIIGTNNAFVAFNTSRIIQFPEMHISKDKNIDLYNGNTFVFTIPANSSYADYDLLSADQREKKIRDIGVMNYERGICMFDSSHPYWTQLRGVDNADYVVYFADGTWKVMNTYGTISGNRLTGDPARHTAKPIFMLSKKAFPDRDQVTKAVFTADFTYKTYITTQGWQNVVDRRSDTQWQTLWMSEPPSDLAILNIALPEITPINFVDIIAGFYIFDEATYKRKYGFTNTYSLKYSTDGSVYNYIGKDTSGFELGAGNTKSFDEGALGKDFQAKYLRLHLDKAEKVNYGPVDRNTGKIPDAWLAAIVEIKLYKDLVLVGECKLTPTQSQGTQAKWLYDPDGLLSQAGDILYKIEEVNEYLDTQKKVDNRAKGLLSEFYKNHDKAQVDIVYHPSILVGDTISVIDSLNYINQNYFVEGISSNNGRMSLTLGYYP